jgi:Zc3h12a-like Ribonuclease NYN domain
MSRRPKLVEIGVPIGTTSAANGPTPPSNQEDHSASFSRTRMEHDVPFCSTKKERQSSATASSLSRAAVADGIRYSASSSPHALSSQIQRPSTTTYKVVIGGESDGGFNNNTSPQAPSIYAHERMAHAPCHHYNSIEDHQHHGMEDEDDSFEAMMTEDHSERYQDGHPHHNKTIEHYRHHPRITRTHLEIGVPPPSSATYCPLPFHGVEKMTGVEDLRIPGPLIVMDGANVAYAYAQALQDNYGGATTKLQPHLQGLQVACDYFLQHEHPQEIRVVVVLPQPWLSRYRNPTATMSDDDQEPAAILSNLSGWLVAAPSRDDDDAYVLRIALREQQRRRPPHGPVYVLSNDWFRDAQARDAAVRSFLQSAGGERRISYTFGNLGRLDDHGDPVLDIVPNPRHSFIQWMEEQYQN